MPSRRRSSSVRRSRAGQKLSLPSSSHSSTKRRSSSPRSSTKRRSSSPRSSTKRRSSSPSGSTKRRSSSPSGSTKRRRVASSSPRRSSIRKPMTSRLRKIRGVSAYLRRMQKPKFFIN